MDISTLSQFVASFGFPVVACCAMGWFVKYSTDKSREEIDKLNTRHSEDMGNLRDTLENNTLVIQQLLDYLKGGDDNAWYKRSS